MRMKIAELARAYRKFELELDQVGGGNLIFAWIAHENRIDRSPDLDMLKKSYFERRLDALYGAEKWRHFGKLRETIKNDDQLFPVGNSSFRNLGLVAIDARRHRAASDVYRCLGLLIRR